jgi:cell division cycle 20-like protein 1 (cofactor of APC complex)
LDTFYNLVLHFQGNLLAVGTRCGSVHVYDIAANKRVIEMEGHTDRVGSLAWNGSVLSTGSRDRLILEYDMRTSAHMTVRKLAGHLREVSRNVFTYY